MRILSLDIATATGWAVWDMDRSEASMLTGCFRCESEGKGAVARLDKRDDMRRKVRALIKEHRPDAAILEAPLQIVETYKGPRKPKRGDMLAAVAPDGDAETGGGGPNASTVLMLNQLFAVAWASCRGLIGEHVYEVPSRSWQTITKAYPGNTKERSIEACRVLKIPLPSTKWQRENAADAAMMAVWGAGHIQEIKMMRRIAA